MHTYYTNHYLKTPTAHEHKVRSASVEQQSRIGCHIFSRPKTYTKAKKILKNLKTLKNHIHENESEVVKVK